jgi:hypothetical protein
MSSTLFGRASLAVTICALGGMVAAHAVCCRTYFDFADGSGCQQSTIQTCQVGAPDDDGNVALTPALGYCFTYYPSGAEDVYWGPCGGEPEGWHAVGPQPGEGGMCCFVHPDVDREITSTPTQIAMCFGADCEDGQPVE